VTLEHIASQVAEHLGGGTPVLYIPHNPNARGLGRLMEDPTSRDFRGARFGTIADSPYVASDPLVMGRPDSVEVTSRPWRRCASLV